MDSKARNIRAIKTLALAAAVFLFAVVVFDPMYNKKQEVDNRVRKLVKKAEKIEEIEKFAISNDKNISGIKMPENQELQLLLFRKEVLGNLKQCGLKWSMEPFFTSEKGIKEKATGLKVFYLKVSVQSTFAKTLDLLEKLKANSYLYAIEEFDFNREGNDNQKAKLDLTLSTLAK